MRARMRRRNSSRSTSSAVPESISASLRQNEATRTLPVIVISTLAGDGQLQLEHKPSAVSDWQAFFVRETPGAPGRPWIFRKPTRGVLLLD